MALTTIPSELSSVSGISDSSTSTAITIDSSQNVTFAGNITTGSNTISGVLSSVTGSIGSAATATTQAASDNSTKLATTAYVTTALANMVDSAPSTLNTLNELAAALGDDPNFATTVTNNIATKLPLAGGTMTGALNMGTQNITNAGTVTSTELNVSGNVVIGSGGLDVSGIGGTFTALNMRAGSGYSVLYGQTTATSTNSAAMQIVGATSGASAGAAAELLGVIQIAAESDSSTNATGYMNFFTGSGGSVTERMRIDSSGRVGIGVSDPSTALDVNGVINVRTSGLEFGRITTNNTSASDGGLTFQTVSGGSFSEAMRIDSDGDVTITGSGNGTLTIDSSASAYSSFLNMESSSGGNSTIACSQFLQINTNGAERMRIDSGGRLLVSQTSAVGIGGTPADVNGTEIGKGYINLNRDDTASANQIQFGKNNAVAGRITTTTTTSYVETSDRRVKSNIADAEDCGTAIDSMQVRKFDWTESGEHHPFGMIAQELLEIAPIAVDAPDDPSEMMGIDYSKLVPMLVKEIQSLRARVQQLENN